ncbi:MAG: nucleotide excision repair endonuclease [Verrucomicrobiota bacterium]|jgi:predicted GIY-YIG superfamily endonuclease
MGQTLLIPDPKPLEQRLGKRFFRRTPRRPGVYLMKDAGDQVLYVGKAKDLKQRLSNYRVANPDRMPRRHLRMVREVARIEFQFCASESAALKHESKLLRSLKPRFNRAGVWPGKARFIVWRLKQRRLELGVVETPETGWLRFGPLNSSATELHRSLARLFWLAINSDRPVSDLPVGWLSGELPTTVTIHCDQAAEEIAAALDTFFWRSPDDFVLWLVSRFRERIHPFERTFIDSHLEIVGEFFSRKQPPEETRHQLILL